ncbi:MAG: cytosine permease [Fibrobacter sp.]|nr:cytosine permease [Fibrobacter sp.]
MGKRTNLLTNALIWFGVAVSVSEIEAGLEIGVAAPAGGIWLPLILGHVLGGLMLFAVGLIGAKVRLNAMETTVSTYGKYGSKFFASLNLLQLVGWIAVLNAQGAMALGGLNVPLSMPIVCVFLAVLIAVWIFIGLRNASRISMVTMSLLAVLLAVLTVKLFGAGVVGAEGGAAQGAASSAHEALTFWQIFEISIAMPLSWLPVISDYTKDVEKPFKATAVSAAIYTLASFWMYFVGIQIAGTGSDIAGAILLAGLGIPGVIIVVLSTVTTNFLAANSAGESAKSIYGKLNPKAVGVVVCALSTVLAISGIVDHYIHFLYLIASVFAPMAAVLLVAFFAVKEHLNKKWFWALNLVAWLAGFIVYQVAGNSPVGPTITSLAVSAVITLLAKLKK